MGRRWEGKGGVGLCGIVSGCHGRGLPVWLYCEFPGLHALCFNGTVLFTSSQGMALDGWMDGLMDHWMDGWIDGSLDGWMDHWMDGTLNRWMDHWMDGWLNEWVG